MRVREASGELERREAVERRHDQEGRGAVEVGHHGRRQAGERAGSGREAEYTADGRSTAGE